jgi:tetratricopeptide (TPR) repeat protein
VRIEASRPGRQPDAAAWAKSREEEVLKSLRDAKKVSFEPVGVCGRFGQRLVLEGTDGSGRRVRRAVHFLKDEDRAFQITADLDAGRLEVLQPVVAEILSRFRVLNDLLSEGALERGLQAIDACDEGDKKLFGKSPQESLPHYDQAVALFPRFAGALNNKGIALLDLDDLDGARQALQKAHQLFNEDLTIRLNLAGCRLQEAGKLLEAGKPLDAGRLADEAKSLVPPEDDVLHNVAVVYANIGVWYANKDNFDVGLGWFKKALQLRPKDAELSKSVAILYGNLAIQNLNKGNPGRAQSLAQEALKYDPTSVPAKEVLEALKKK